MSIVRELNVSILLVDIYNPKRAMFYAAFFFFVQHSFLEK